MGSTGACDQDWWTGKDYNFGKKGHKGKGKGAWGAAWDLWCHTSSDSASSDDAAQLEEYLAEWRRWRESKKAWKQTQRAAREQWKSEMKTAKKVWKQEMKSLEKAMFGPQTVGS